ncbi:hypothetical protein BYT27DRAFT_7180448 [Phlegmacium glaucopus]|nr:hypothetical protein BYT27DRAFT_7180448 [Phlegmacium glaucopus]
MPTASSSDSEQKTQRGLKRKTDDLVVEDSYSPDSRAKRRRSSRESLTDRTEKEVPDATSSQTTNPVVNDQVLFRPDGKFYYDSGDIFLIVERTFFCVHAKKLKAAGGIFEDLLSSNNVRPSAEEYLYDLPAFRVSLVSLRQFRFFLAYIYDAIPLMKLPDSSGDYWLYWEAAIALLDVSTKLNLHVIRKSTISALECLFPTDMTGNEIPKFRPVIAGYKYQRDETMFCRTFPIKAINLFHEHDVPSLLPMAYYHAAQLSLEDIVNGVKDGNVLWKLNSTDVMKVLKGREILKTSRRQVLFLWLDDKKMEGEQEEGSADCEIKLMLNGNYCWENFRDIYLQFNRSGFLDDITNGLQCLSDAAEDLFRGYVCQGCWSDAMHSMDVGKRKNWANLPEYFGFEDWDAVKKMQESVDSGWDGTY